jgi:hypothetical protein
MLILYIEYFRLVTGNFLRVPITQRKYLFRNYTTNHTTPAPCGATGQRRDRSLPRPTWLPDGRSWVNSSSMSELGIVCRRLTLSMSEMEAAKHNIAQFFQVLH